MIVAGSAVHADLDVQADIAVVGSGAGGAVFAKLLTDAGHRVVVLEEGGYYTSADFTQDERDMYPRLYKDRGTQATADQAIGILQGRCVGGSTVVNYLDCFRSPPRLLAEWREVAGLGALTEERMAGFFEAVEEVLSVRQIGVEQLNANNAKLWIAAQRLGWKGDTFHRNALGCIGSGYCGLGCAYDAKQSMALTYIPLASNGGALIHANARVRRILFEGDRAVGLEGDVLDPDTDLPRHRLRVRAKLVVVACGSINTPVLLLASGARDPSGQIGRNLHVHPAFPVIGEYDEEVRAHEGIKQGYYIGEFSGVLHGHPDDLLIEGIGAPPGLSAPLFPGTGDAHMDWLARRDRIASAIVLLRDAGSGRVTVRDDGRPTIRYRLDEERDVPRAKRGIENLIRAFLAAGARRVFGPTVDEVQARHPGDAAAIHERSFAPNRVIVFSAHQMSTCRMGADEAAYPVDPEGRLRAYRNVVVCDASIFPSASGVNPQMTVYGLASHVADMVRSEPRRYGL
ncbi:GMC family oxidoreductase [Myxococcota bacterium]|nr:GMC family oxidoreductase [Myxococcota bacterium]